MQCPWGLKAFQGYLGDATSEWLEYDATELVKSYEGPLLKILLDQGDEDTFLKQGQLLPENFLGSVQDSKKSDVVQVSYRLQQGYDHSYWFISSFIRDHFCFHFGSN
jgi:S-formylglutathione hydrolase